jgi:hypothetical protein
MRISGRLRRSDGHCALTVARGGRYVRDAMRGTVVLCGVSPDLVAGNAAAEKMGWRTGGSRLSGSGVISGAE